jgi:hypothetical protein
MTTAKKRSKAKAAVSKPTHPKTEVQAAPVVSPQLEALDQAPPAANVLVRPGPPPPDVLLEMAMAERDERELSEYSQTISVLKREKHFTFRQIAAWLNNNGIDADHNAVYRAYMRTIPDYAKQDVEEQLEEDAREEAERE